MIMAALTGGCRHHEAPVSQTASATEAGPAKEVHVVAVRLEPWARTVRVQGSLLADEAAVIGSKIAGRVETVHVDLGSVVKQGEALVVLNTGDLKLRVDQAAAQLKQACSAIGLTPDDDETKLDLESSPQVMLEQALVEEATAAVARADRLLPTKAMTEGEYDTVIAQLKTAKARHLSALNAVSEQVSLIGVRRADLALAQQQLADARVVAPFDALVDARHVSPGAYVQVGQAVVALVRIDRLRFTAGVPENKGGAVRVGQRIEIRLAGRDEPVAAEISRVSPTVLQTSRSVRIEADVANADLELQAGLFAEAEITVDAAATALTVPATAVSQFAGVQKIWAVKDGAAAQQTVLIGRREAECVEILEGAPEGTLVVANVADGYDGPVVAIEKPPGGALRAESPDPETTTLPSVILRSSEESSLHRNSGQSIRRTSG
jgi:membrane fusion protein (multidrug efflux system)